MSQKILFVIPVLFVGCTDGDKIQRFECFEQNTGSACFKLATKKTGTESLELYKKGCDLGNQESCTKKEELEKAKP